MHAVIDNHRNDDAFVSMALAEAATLSFALTMARARLRGALRVLPNRNLQSAQGPQAAEEFATIRAQLDALDEFHRCHCEAHGLQPPQPNEN